jgi:hypothetical protein
LRSLICSMREAGAAEHKVAGSRWVWVSEAQSQISETEPYARGTGSSNPTSSTEESARVAGFGRSPRPAVYAGEGDDAFRGREGPLRVTNPEPHDP